MRLAWHKARLGSARLKAACVALGLMAVPCAAQAAVPTTTSIEGTLFSSGGGPAADGNYNVVFSIYKDASGGAAVYSEGPVAVALKGGLFTYQIGSKTALTATTLAGLPTAFLGVKIDQDAELPRQPINSTPFSLRAGVAEGVDCTGCVAEKALDPNILKDYTKTAAMTAVAKSGNYADLIGAPSIPVVSAAGKSGNYADLLNLPTLANVAKTGNYADLIGAPALGKVATTNKYADLTGLPTLAAINTACGTNLVVKGIKADGTLDCAAGGGGPVEVKNLPADGIDEISNGLIFNQFNDTFSGAAGTKILDNSPIGVSDTIDYPDIGLSQKLTVTLDISNSDISTLTISLFDPAGVEYVLYKKGASGTAVKTSYPSPTTPVSGDLTTWVGKNPKGKWILKVVDTGYLNNGVDGAINSWSITSQTLSSKKIAVAGNMLVAGTLAVTGATSLTGGVNGAVVATGVITGKNVGKWVRAAGGGTYCAGSYQDIAGLSVTVTTNGNQLRITGDVPVYYGSHSALRATLDGNYAGKLGGYDWGYSWQDGLQCTSCGGCGNWTNLRYDRIFDKIPAGTHVIKLQVYTDGACASCGLVVGNGSMHGFLAVQELLN